MADYYKLHDAPKSARNSGLQLFRVFSRVAVVCTFGYVIGFVLWRFLVNSPTFGQLWPVQLSEVFAAWALLPVPFLLIALAFGRRYWYGLALLIPMLWLGNAYGGQFVPRLGEAAYADGGARTLRVMTFNTWLNADESGELAAKVTEWQPDVMAFQEVWPPFDSNLEALSEQWPYQVHAVVRGVTSMALLSKWPIVSYDTDHDWQGCHCTEFLLDWDGELVRVIAVHIRAPSLGVRNYREVPIRVQGFDASVQAVSYAALLPRIERSQEPLIVMGDFNTTERQEGYQLLYAAGLRDAHEEVGFGFGFTYPAPFSRVKWLPVSLIRIDHVFFDSSWRAIDTWTSSLMGSDHRALVADLQMVERGD